MITWDALLLRYYALAATVGSATLWVLWRATRHVPSPSLRALARATFSAFVFTPAIVPIREIGGAVPVPASWMFFYGFFGRDGRGIDTATGGAFILSATIVLWFVFVAASRKHPREENA